MPASGPIQGDPVGLRGGDLARPPEPNPAGLIVLYTGFLPLTIVCAIRAYRAVVVRREPGIEHRYELGLILAALVAAELSTRLLMLIHSIGGFLVWPVSPLLAVSGQMPRHFAYTAHGLFVLFGADFFGRKVSFATLLILLHLAGLALAGWGLLAGVRRFFRDNDLVDWTGWPGTASGTG